MINTSVQRMQLLFIYFSFGIYAMTVKNERTLLCSKNICIIISDSIDECVSDPCFNNGTCFDDVNRFSCSCAAGFNGTLCESKNNCCW